MYAAASYEPQGRLSGSTTCQGILKSVKTIAMVGASPDPTKFSYGVLRVLHETGYDMIPVNPLDPDVTDIRGLPVVHSLEEIDAARRHGPGIPPLPTSSSILPGRP